MLPETGKNKKREGLFPSLIFFVFAKTILFTSFGFLLIVVFLEPSFNVLDCHWPVVFLFKLFIIRFFLIKFSFSIWFQCETLLLILIMIIGYNHEPGLSPNVMKKILYSYKMPIVYLFHIYPFISTIVVTDN